MMRCCVISQLGREDHQSGLVATSGITSRCIQILKKIKLQDSADFLSSLTVLVRWGFIFGWFSFLLGFFGGEGLFWFGFGEGVIEPFLSLLLSYRHKWLSITKAPTEGNLC